MISEKKERIGLAAAFLAVLAAIFIIVFFTGDKASPYQKIAINISSDSFNAEIACSGGGFYLPACSKNCTLTLICPSGYYISVRDALSSSPAEKKYYNGDKITLPESGETACLCRGSTVQPIKFMTSENIGALFITTKEDGLARVRADKAHKESGSISAVRCNGIADYSGKLKYIRGRGNSTWDEEKKPFQIRFSSPAELFGMSEGEKWVLLANANDPSNLRNKIVYDTAKNIGLAYSPECEFADLYFNGEYLGLYLVSKKVEIDASSVDIANLEAQNEDINPTLPENFPQISGKTENGASYKGFDLSVNPADITGGYLMQLELDDRYALEPGGFLTSRAQPVTVASPQYPSEHQIRYIADFVQQFEDAIDSPDGVNPTTGKHYTEYIDSQSWAEKYLIEEFYQNFDFGVTRQYFYKLPQNAGGKIFAGPVWDYDLSMGNFGAPVTCLIGSHEKLGINAENRWFSRLYTKQDFYGILTQSYKYKLSPQLEKLQNGGLREYFDKIKAAAEMDCASRNGDMGAFEGSFEQIEQFISGRRQFLDSLWIAGDKYYTLEINT
ncbi:MAG: CotH kinase family protein, partial [Clostridia bacterium]|nr:CotH kinase family protein [Clostridia bacterium]